MYFLGYLLIGLFIGWAANRLARGRDSGLFVNLIVGLIGGVLGGWIFSLVGLIPIGRTGSLFTAAAGALLAVWIAHAITRKRETN